MTDAVPTQGNSLDQIMADLMNTADLSVEEIASAWREATERAAAAQYEAHVLAGLYRRAAKANSGESG